MLYIIPLAQLKLFSTHENSKVLSVTSNFNQRLLPPDNYY